MRRQGKNSHNLIAVYQVPLLINCLASVRVTIVCNPQGCAVFNDGSLKGLRMRRTYAIVDIGAVRFSSERDNFGP